MPYTRRSMQSWQRIGAGLALAISGCRAKASPEHLALLAHEYGYQMPASVPAGLVRIDLRNEGHDTHEALLIRFTDPAGNAAAYVDSVRANVDFPAFAEDVGGPGLTLPGDSTTVWLRLTPGRYSVVCWKGDHLRLGMAHDLEVTATVRPEARPPAAASELALREYAFELSQPLTRGRQILHIQNLGTEPHEADIFRLTDSTTVEDYVAWLKGGETGPPPVEPVGGLGDLVAGRELWLDLNLEAGRYFIFCQVPARPDGRPHYEHGMVLEFSVS